MTNSYLLQSKNCSLHLTQKFAFWYPSHRYTPILSSQSAPGIIIATGTVGKTMAGQASVYMSRDAGVTWKQVGTCRRVNGEIVHSGDLTGGNILVIGFKR